MLSGPRYDQLFQLEQHLFATGHSRTPVEGHVPPPFEPHGAGYRSYQDGSARHPNSMSTFQCVSQCAMYV